MRRGSTDCFAERQSAEPSSDTRITTTVPKIQKTGTFTKSGTFGFFRQNSRASTNKRKSVFQSSTAVAGSHAGFVWRKKKLIYHLDSLLSRRRWQCVTLIGVGLVQVAIGGLLWSLVIEEGDYEDSTMFNECAWSAWTFMADPGSHGDVVTRGQRITAALICFGGILFFSSLLALVVESLREKMEALRQGRSMIIEKDHVLIVNWNDKAIHLVHELCIANESENGGVIVVLGHQRKEAMEIELAAVLPKSKRLGTKVIFRSGSAGLTSDLTKVSAHTAKAIVMLSNEEDADDADAETLRSLLALNGLKYPIVGHVIAELRDGENSPLVKLVGGGNVDTLVSHDLLGRLMAMAARRPGLSKVYEAMLGFEGDEFYIAEWPELVGLSFGDLLTRFPDAVPIGLRHSDGSIELRPSVDQVIVAGDEVVVMAEDNDTYRPEEPQECIEGECPEVEEEAQEMERILFCGWRKHIRDMILFLDSVVPTGSEVHMMTHSVPFLKRNARLLEEGLDVTKLKNLKIIHHDGNTSVRRKLEALPIHTFTSAMIFADQEYELDPTHSDSHSLATLLLCRDIQVNMASGLPRHGKSRTSFSGGQWGYHENVWSIAHSERSVRYPPDLILNTEEHSSKVKSSFPVVCEILDPRTQRIITGNRQVALASDFCQSNKLVAQIMSMIAEERSVKRLLEELWGVHGASIDVVPASRYIRDGESASFWQLSKRGMNNFREVLIGYQLRDSPEATVLNPSPKNKPMIWDGCDIAVIRASQTSANPFEGQGELNDLFMKLQSEKNIREHAREISDDMAMDQEFVPLKREPEQTSRRDSDSAATEGLTESPQKSEWRKRGSSIISWLSQLGWDQPVQEEGGAEASASPRSQDPSATQEGGAEASASPRSSDHPAPDLKSHKPVDVKDVMSRLKTLRAEMSDREWKRVELSLAVLTQVLQASNEMSKI